MRTTIRSLGVIALAALAVVAQGGAQVKVEVTPFAGRYAPTEDLIPVGRLPLPAHVRQQAGLAFGGRVTAWLTDRFAIEGAYGYSGRGAAQTTFQPLEAIYPCCAAGTSDTTGDTWMVSARVLFLISGRPSSTAVYILAGPAYVGHGDPAFDIMYASHNTVGMTVSSPGAVVGIGARFKVPKTALALRTDLEYYRYDAPFSARFSGQFLPRGVPVSWSGSQVQNDLLLSLGLSVHPSDGPSARQR